MPRPDMCSSARRGRLPTHPRKGKDYSPSTIPCPLDARIWQSNLLAFPVQERLQALPPIMALISTIWRHYDGDAKAHLGARVCSKSESHDSHNR